MKRLALIAALLLSANIAAQAQGYGLPELHTIKTATLAPSYGCRPQEEFQKGYQGTALYLSDFSKRRNSPDLLFNGACGSKDEFNSSTAGDDMAFLVDLGSELQLEKLSASDVFQLYQLRSNPGSPYAKHAQSILSQSVKVVPNHTYAVFLNKREIRGLFVFTVVNHTPNKQVELKYAVKEYQIMDVRAQSPGFNWEQNNSAAPTNPPVEKAQNKNQN
jgi:hypothetical protein